MYFKHSSRCFSRQIASQHFSWKTSRRTTMAFISAAPLRYGHVSVVSIAPVSPRKQYALPPRARLGHDKSKLTPIAKPGQSANQTFTTQHESVTHQHETVSKEATLNLHPTSLSPTEQHTDRMFSNITSISDGSLSRSPPSEVAAIALIAVCHFCPNVNAQYRLFRKVLKFIVQLLKCITTIESLTPLVCSVM